MFDRDSIDYYRMRERQERAYADAAADPRVAAIHLEFARRYSNLVHGPVRLVGSPEREVAPALVAMA